MRGPLQHREAGPVRGTSTSCARHGGSRYDRGASATCTSSSQCLLQLLDASNGGRLGLLRLRSCLLQRRLVGGVGSSGRRAQLVHQLVHFCQPLLCGFGGALGQRGELGLHLCYHKHNTGRGREYLVTFITSRHRLTRHRTRRAVRTSS